MAIKVPSAIKRDSAGSNTLFTITFSGTDDIDNNDVYISHIPEVVGWWTNRTDAPTQKKEGIDAKWVQASSAATQDSVFTFYTGEDNCEGILYVLAKA